MRNLEPTTLRKYGYFKAGFKGRTVQVAPYFDMDGAVACQKVRMAGKEFAVLKAGPDAASIGKCQLFGRHVYGDGYDRKVVVAFGELDAMSVAQVVDFKIAVVSVNAGDQTAVKCLQANYLWLDRFEEIIFWFDGDEPGQAVVNACCSLFKVSKVKVVKNPDGAKDASDLRGPPGPPGVPRGAGGVSMKRALGAAFGLLALALGTAALAPPIPTWADTLITDVSRLPAPALAYARVGQGAVKRVLTGKLGDLPYTPQDMGAACDSSTPDDSAFAALAIVDGAVSLPKGVCRLATTTVLPKGRGYKFEGGGIMADTGRKLTIRGTVDAPPRRIFWGGGTIEGMRYNRPEWWGMNPQFNSGEDSAAAINKAVASAMASFDGANIADGGRPTVDISGGFPTICSPIEVYIKSFTPFTFKGAGVLNGGSRIDTCPTFTGGNMFNVHGSNTGDAGYDIKLQDFQLLDLNQRSTACVRFVPEGAGYQLNSGAQRPSLIDNVHANGCPIGFDIVNTVMLRMNAPTYVGLRNNNNTGIRFASAGGGFTSAAGNITVYDASLFPCPGVNASNCTNTANVVIDANGAGVATGAYASVAAIAFEGQTIFWGANSGVKGTARFGGVINDIWMKGVQFDGIGCEYVNFRSTGTDNSSGATVPSAINQVYIYDSYHTTNAPGCIAHTWQSDAGGYIRGIQDHHNTMIGMNGLGIFVFGTKDTNVDHNNLIGGQNGVPAIKVDGNSYLVHVDHNNCDTDNAPGSRWNACVRFEAPTNYLSETGNLSFNSGPALSNASAGANNRISAN